MCTVLYLIMYRWKALGFASKHFLCNCDKGRLIQPPFSCMISTLKLACISVDQRKFCRNVSVPPFRDTNGTASGHHFGQFKWW